MHIGFDLDNVFIDTPPFIPDAVIDRLYRKQSTRKLAYRFPSSFEQSIRKISHLSIFRPALTKNIEICKKRRRKADTFFLISSRYKFLEPETNAVIRKYQLDRLFDTMVFNFENKQPHIFKDKVLKELAVDRYVDDDIHLLDYVAERNKNIHFFWLNGHLDKKMNQNLWAITDISQMFRKIV